MIYQIQLKKETASAVPLWQDYGSTIMVDGQTTFSVFQTSDVVELQTKLEELDRAFGYSNIRPISIPTFSVSLIIDEEAADKGIQTDPITKISDS